MQILTMNGIEPISPLTFQYMWNQQSFQFNQQ